MAADCDRRRDRRHGGRVIDGDRYGDAPRSRRRHARPGLLDKVGLYLVAIRSRAGCDGATCAARYRPRARSVAHAAVGLADHVARTELEDMSLAGIIPFCADLCRVIVVIPQTGAKPAARRWGSRRPVGRRVRRDGLLSSLSGGIGNLRTDMVFAWHPARDATWRFAGPPPVALVNFCPATHSPGQGIWLPALDLSLLLSSR